MPYHFVPGKDISVLAEEFGLVPLWNQEEKIFISPFNKKIDYDNVIKDVM